MVQSFSILSNWIRTVGFKFKYHAPQYPEFYQLRLDKSIIHLAIDSTETLNLSANAADFANDYELTGSDECVKMRIVAQESAKLKKRIDELSRAMSSNSDRVDDLRKQAIEDLAAYKRKCSIWYWKIRPRQLHIILFFKK